jgi:hypothetical protein
MKYITRVDIEKIYKIWLNERVENETLIRSGYLFWKIQEYNRWCCIFCSRIYNISDLIIVESTIKYFNLEFIILTYSDYRRDLN